MQQREDSDVTTTIPIAEIVIGNRARKDMGDIDSLASSMHDLGQLQPILLGRGNVLIAGARRIEAARSLGWPTIQYIQTNDLDTAALALKAERDENSQRKPLVPSEMGAIAAQLLAIEKPSADGRQAESRAKPGQKVGSAQGGGTVPPPSKPEENARNAKNAGKARDKVGSALGVSGKTAERAAAMTAAAQDDPSQYGDLPAMMDREGVKAAYAEYKARKRRPKAPDAVGDASEDELPAVYDEGNTPVPERAREAFAGVPELRKLCRTLDDAVAAIESMATWPTFRHVLSASAAAQIRAARRTIYQGRPSHVCDYCRGLRDDCRGCAGSGFLAPAAHAAAVKSMEVAAP